MLFHGLPEGETNGRLLDSSTMERAADDVWARLAKDEDGSVRLRTV
jgi:hypothetical protein